MTSSGEFVRSRRGKVSLNVNKGIVSDMSERPAQAALGGDIGFIVMLWFPKVNQVDCLVPKGIRLSWQDKRRKDCK